MGLTSVVHFAPPLKKQVAAWDIDNTDVQQLQVIFKTVERCNINCSYCYYFFGGDNSFEARPALVSQNVVTEVASFLVQAALDIKIPRVQVVFHGGEPMMQPKNHFNLMCTELRSAFKDTGVELILAIQTNGTLVDEEWCELFVQHGVSVGISLDGPREINDRFRLDRKGRSTYDATVAGIRQLFEYERKMGISFGLGCLTVINPKNEYKSIYKHLSEDLEFKQIGFLLPDCCHDSSNSMGAEPAVFGSILIDIFEAWVSSPIANVENISRCLDYFRAGKSNKVFSKDRSLLGNQIIVIHSDGSLAVDDSLIPASAWRNSLPRSNVSEITLREWLKAPFFAQIYEALRTIPNACAECSWKNMCRGGDIENRFSVDDDFDRKSIFCDGLDIFYNHVTQYLLSNGYPPDVLLKRLDYA